MSRPNRRSDTGSWGGRLSPGAAVWIIVLLISVSYVELVRADTPVARERSPAASAPIIKPVGDLAFYQMDTLRVGLDSLVTDSNFAPRQMEWEIELLDTRYGDNPNSSNDQHLKYEIDPRTRTLLFTSTRFFVADDIRLRLAVRNPDGETDRQIIRVSVLPVEGVPGKVYELKQNRPNPFRDRTTIEYWIPVRARVKVEVYDLLGRPVRTLVDNRSHSSGVHQVPWEPDGLASGFYVVRLQALGRDNSRFVTSIRLTYIR